MTPYSVIQDVTAISYSALKKRGRIWRVPTLKFKERAMRMKACLIA